MLCTTFHRVSISYGHKVRERCKQRGKDSPTFYTESLIGLPLHSYKEL